MAHVIAGVNVASAATGVAVEGEPSKHSEEESVKLGERGSPSRFGVGDTSKPRDGD